MQFDKFVFYCFSQNDEKNSTDVARQQCGNRRVDSQFGGSVYMFSWLSPGSPRFDWNSARGFCQSNCMDLVAMETPQENAFIESIVTQGKNPPVGHFPNFETDIPLESFFQLGGKVRFRTIGLLAHARARVSSGPPPASPSLPPVHQGPTGARASLTTARAARTALRS